MNAGKQKGLKQIALTNPNSELYDPYRIHELYVYI